MSVESGDALNEKTMKRTTPSMERSFFSKERSRRNPKSLLMRLKMR